MEPTSASTPSQRVFVTGGSGFIGRHVVRALTSRGHIVTELKRTSRVSNDLLDTAAYEGALKGCDTVLHLAGATGRAPRVRYFRTNVDGTAALLQAAERAGVRRFIFISTIAVKFPDLRLYHYAESKVEAEKLVRQSKLDSVIVRPTLVLGRESGQTQLLLRLARLPVIPAFGGGRNKVQPVDARDLADLLVDTLEASLPSGTILEYGGPEAVSLRHVLGVMHRQLMDTRPQFLPVPLWSLLPVWSAMERLLAGVLPFSVGQLATFRFDGTAQPNPLWERRRSRMFTVEAMIADCVD